MKASCVASTQRPIQARGRMRSGTIKEPHPCRLYPTYRIRVYHCRRVCRQGRDARTLRPVQGEAGKYRRLDNHRLPDGRSGIGHVVRENINVRQRQDPNGYSRDSRTLAHKDYARREYRRVPGPNPSRRGAEAIDPATSTLAPPQSAPVLTCALIGHRSWMSLLKPVAPSRLAKLGRGDKPRPSCTSRKQNRRGEPQGTGERAERL